MSSVFKSFLERLRDEALTQNEINRIIPNYALDNLNDSKLLNNLDTLIRQDTATLAIDKPTKHESKTAYEIDFPSNDFASNNNYKDDNRKKIFESKLDTQSLDKTEITLDTILNLQGLREYVEAFDQCLLKQNAKNTVFARGDEHSSIMCIGEAPGAQEDELGIPFCGQSGKLLDNIFTSLKIKNPYITNTVFWRPPMNRRPTIEEIEICKPLVQKHIALHNPKLLIMIGGVAVEGLLEIKEASITKIRKKVFDYSNKYLKKSIPAVAIFHPAYLLRQQNKKKEMWEDMLWIVKNFGSELYDANSHQ